MLNLRDIINWKKHLGLLPINLHHNTDYNRFILQNGGTSDFCLGYEDDNNKEEYYSLAWSSNTKNFLSFESNNKINIYNWKKREPELVSLNTVEENFTKFYDYLVSNSLKSENDIVPFVLNIYRKLRNYLNENNIGKESLNSIFLLFAAYEEQKPINEIDFKKWGIEPIVYQIKNFEKYLEEFSKGLDEYIKPNVELIIRHASGALFQEAHQEALFFNKNFDLFSGTLTSEYKSSKLLYSSIHYTPSFIARIIVEQTLKQVDLKTKKLLKILDPACGTSQFAMETLKQLKSFGYEGKVEITGFDNSETAINTSNFLLTYEKREWGDKLDFKFYLVDDSLKNNWNFDYDIVFMNPPFISWEQMGKEYRTTVRDNLGKCFEKRPNQASAFFLKAINSLNKEGAIGCILPSSIFTLDSYKKLRNVLDELIKTNLLGKLGNFVFENALTDISFYIGSKNSQENIPPIFLWTSNEKGVASKAIRNLRIYNNSNKQVINKNDFSIYRPLKFPIIEDSWKTISYEENHLLKKLETFIQSGDLVRIKDVFTVKQGVRTGNNYVFKITKNYFNKLPDYEKKYFRPALDNESIRHGMLTIRNYVWYPYNENGLLIKDENVLKQEVPTYYRDILFPEKDSLIKRARKNINNWWTLSEHRAWLIKKKPKLVSAEFGGSGSFAFDHKGTFVVERGHGWIPKKVFDNEDYYFYLSIFSSTIFKDILSIYSKQLAGGKWWDLSNKHTKNIPIPKLTNEIRDSVIYAKLSHIGKEISSGEIKDFKIIDEYLNYSFYKYY